MGPRAGLDGRKISYPPEFDPGPSSLQSVVKPTELPGAPRCPEVSRKLRFPDYVTMVQGGGKVVSLTHRPLLPPGNTPGTHFC